MERSEEGREKGRKKHETYAIWLRNPDTDIAIPVERTSVVAKISRFEGLLGTPFPTFCATETSIYRVADKGERKVGMSQRDEEQ
jgi:hypothetical protein